jgi:hypothetical protein
VVVFAKVVAEQCGTKDPTMVPIVAQLLFKDFGVRYLKRDK